MCLFVCLFVAHTTDTADTFFRDSVCSGVVCVCVFHSFIHSFTYVSRFPDLKIINSWVGGHIVCVEGLAWAKLERSMEQILVVVASTQMRTLRTEAGKVFMWTVVEHELVDAKNQTKVGFFQS